MPAGKSDHVVWEDGFPGFGLRLRAGGSRNWVFQYAIGKKQFRMSLGSAAVVPLAKAREIASEMHAKVRLGIDPSAAKAENKKRTGETFEACLQLYLAKRRADPKLRQSSYAEIERHLMRNLQGLHAVHIAAVDRRAIAIELDRLSERGPVQANRTRSSLGKFLGWCVGQGYIETNPTLFTNKNPEASRDRVLNLDELVQILCAVSDGDYGDILRLLALTGQRASEIADLHWDEIDTDVSVITLPARRVKNRRVHTVPLSPPAAAILKARTRSEDRNLVFGRGHGDHGFSGWSRCKERLDAVVPIAPWVIHDIRRSVSTGLGNIGVPPHVIEQITNHQSGSKAGVSGIYNHSRYEPEKRKALEDWATHLMAAVQGQRR